MGVLKVKTADGFVDAGAALSLIGGTVEAVLEELTITENGEYTPRSGVDGFSKVIAAIEASGGGVAIQSGSFTPAENLHNYTIAVSGLVKNFIVWKNTNALTYGVRTFFSTFKIDGTEYQPVVTTNTAGTSSAANHGMTPISVSDGVVTIATNSTLGYLVTEQYNWIAW